MQRHHKIFILEIYIIGPGCLFKVRPSVCRIVIFQNPSQIDKNSARFLNNNENFYITWQGSSKL